MPDHPDRMAWAHQRIGRLLLVRPSKVWQAVLNAAHKAGSRPLQPQFGATKAKQSEAYSRDPRIEMANTLWSKATNNAQSEPLATPLTQRRKRQAKGAAPLPSAKRAPRREKPCRICGATILSARDFCQLCAITFSTEQVVQASAAGRIAAQSETAQALRTKTRLQNAATEKSRDPASQPTWLTPDTYGPKVQPLLANIRSNAISAALGVSWQYAAHIRRGLRRPHPRHWLKLAELVGVSSGPK
jgi:hypothetical protein